MVLIRLQNNIDFDAQNAWNDNKIVQFRLISVSSCFVKAIDETGRIKNFKYYFLFRFCDLKLK